MPATWLSVDTRGCLRLSRWDSIACLFTSLRISRPNKVKAYRLMDNRSHEEASWDNDILKSELLDLSGFDIDLELTGFGLDEISSILDSAEPTAGLVDEDDVPPLPAEPVSRPGDLWILGPHRLLCGDATIRTHIERLMDGEMADMVFTDPPYNVDYEQKRKGERTGGRKIKNDALGCSSKTFCGKPARTC